MPKVTHTDMIMNVDAILKSATRMDYLFLMSRRCSVLCTQLYSDPVTHQYIRSVEVTIMLSCYRYISYRNLKLHVGMYGLSDDLLLKPSVP